MDSFGEAVQVLLGLGLFATAYSLYAGLKAVFDKDDAEFPATLRSVDGHRIADGSDFGSDGKLTSDRLLLTAEDAVALASGLSGSEFIVTAAERKPYTRRPYPPGQHGQGRIKLSEYALRLREKQKTRRIYGLLEKQFRGYYFEASRMKGRTGEEMLGILERRLDNVVHRQTVQQQLLLRPQRPLRPLSQLSRLPWLLFRLPCERLLFQPSLPDALWPLCLAHLFAGCCHAPRHRPGLFRHRG